MEAINPPKLDTYTLAKLYYSISNALKYAQSIEDSPAVGPKGKRAISGTAKRLQWCINDILTNLPRESADLMRAEICTWETLSFENVFDEMILMDPLQRETFEQVAKAYRTGDFQLIKEDTV